MQISNFNIISLSRSIFIIPMSKMQPFIYQLNYQQQMLNKIDIIIFYVGCLGKTNIENVIIFTKTLTLYIH